MAERDVRQRLAAILAADVAGYSRLMGDDERATIDALNACRDIFQSAIDGHAGRVVDMAGDSVLAVFDAAIGAAEAAIAAQEALATFNADIPEDRRMRYRIGLNTGDIHEQADGGAYGDGVNVAARLEGLAEPGGICVSGKLRDELRGKLDLDFEDLGEHDVKNIAEPVRAFLAGKRGTIVPRRKVSSGRARAITAALAAMAIAAGLGIWWQLREPAPPAMVAADGTPTDDPTLAMPLGPTIAVLPFTNFGGNPEDEYFSDGITEEIITELARFKNARVLARNSTFQYKGRAVDVRDIGRELGADFVIEGSVRRAGETVRVTAQLLDTRDGTHLWADTWERQLTLDNIFAIQDEITENVAATVAGTYGVVAMSGASEAMHRSSESLSAYECVLRAKWYNAESLGREDHLKVRSCLEQAVQTDPGYADAWAWLAFVYTNEYSFGHNARPEPLARALDAALTAVKLSPHSGDVQRHLTMVYYFHRDRTAFVEAANRAVALTPNDPVVLAETGLMLGFSGEWDRGADLMKKAIALSPTPAGYFYNFLTTYYYHRKEYDEALTWAVKVDQPTFHWPWVNRAAVYGQLGQLAEARGDLEKLETIYPNFGEHARSEYGTWMWNDADVEHFLDGLRLAGLEIPDPAPE